MRIRIFCKICKGSQICTHNTRKSDCKECNGISVCIHNRLKCKICKKEKIQAAEILTNL